MQPNARSAGELKSISVTLWKFTGTNKTKGLALSVTFIWEGVGLLCGLAPRKNQFKNGSGEYEIRFLDVACYRLHRMGGDMKHLSVERLKFLLANPSEVYGEEIKTMARVCISVHPDLFMEDKPLSDQEISEQKVLDENPNHL